LCIKCNNTLLKQIAIVVTVRREAFVAHMTRPMTKDVEEWNEEGKNKDDKEEEEER
jgi:cell division protein FtsI/penicillin-binding protein 2